MVVPWLRVPGSCLVRNSALERLWRSQGSCKQSPLAVYACTSVSLCLMRQRQLKKGEGGCQLLPHHFNAPLQPHKVLWRVARLMAACSSAERAAMQHHSATGPA